MSFAYAWLVICHDLLVSKDAWLSHCHELIVTNSTCQKTCEYSRMWLVICHKDTWLSHCHELYMFKDTSIVICLDLHVSKDTGMSHCHELYMSKDRWIVICHDLHVLKDAWLSHCHELIVTNSTCQKTCEYSRMWHDSFTSLSSSSSPWFSNKIKKNPNYQYCLVALISKRGRTKTMRRILFLQTTTRKWC